MTFGIIGAGFIGAGLSERLGVGIDHDSLAVSRLVQLPGGRLPARNLVRVG